MKRPRGCSDVVGVGEEEEIEDEEGEEGEEGEQGEQGEDEDEEGDEGDEGVSAGDDAWSRLIFPLSAKPLLLKLMRSYPAWVRRSDLGKGDALQATLTGLWMEGGLETKSGGA